jgi:hypothetical protein
MSTTRTSPADLGPIFEEVFCEFVDAGYLRIAYGGAEIGGHL